MKAKVNQDTCISCGLCVNECEDVFHFGSEGKAEAIASDIPEEEEEIACSARDACPVAAIDIKAN